MSSTVQYSNSENDYMGTDTKIPSASNNNNRFTFPLRATSSFSKVSFTAWLLNREKLCPRLFTDYLLFILTDFLMMACVLMPLFLGVFPHLACL